MAHTPRGECTSDCRREGCPEDPEVPVKLIWQKTYVGPFKKAEAEKLAEEVRKIANPEKNLIYDAKIRRRKNSIKYDVYIKTEALDMRNWK